MRITATMGIGLRATPTAAGSTELMAWLSTAALWRAVLAARVMLCGT
jgi:hypothetical protein